VRFTKYHHMVETFPPDRANKAFRVTVLPWRTGGGRSVSDARGLEPTGEDCAVCAVAVTDQVAGCLIPGKGLGDLVRDPLGRWVCSDIGSDQPPPSELENGQAV
jgi:hypothetical protein